MGGGAEGATAAGGCTATEAGEAAGEALLNWSTSETAGGGGLEWGSGACESTGSLATVLADCVGASGSERALLMTPKLLLLQRRARPKTAAR